MSQENVEVVRGMLDATNAGDFDAALTYFAEDAVWEHNLGLGTPMEGSYRAMWRSAAWDATLEAFGAYRFEIDVIEDNGGQVLALGRLVVSGESSGAAVENPIGSVVDVRGSIVRHRFFMNQSKALEAAGLRE